MLQIYLYGDNTEGFLDIDPQTALEMETLFEAFDDDLSTGEFSLPVDFPWTDNNRKLTGFAERLQNFSSKVKEWRVVVYDRGFPELANAKLTMLEKSGSFSYNRGKFSATVSGNKGLFGSLVRNKTLRDLKLGGTITFTDDSSAAFAEKIMKGQYPQYSYMQFATVAIEGFFDTGRPDYTTEFLVQDRVNNTVITGGSSDAWSFANPAGSDGLLRTIPFFNLKFVLKKIFTENGFTLTGDFLNDTDFDYLVLFNNYAIENYAPSNGVDFNRQVVPANHMPDILIKDFLADLLQLFGMYADFSIGANKVNLVYKKAILKNKKVLSLNGLADKTFTAQYQDTATVDGYKIEYTFDSADGYPGDRIKDDITKQKTLVASVGTFGALSVLDIGRQLTTDDIAYVEADNCYYQIADATTTPLKWDAFAERMEGYKTGAGEKTISINVSTLLSYVEFDTGLGLYVKRDCAGSRQPGSYINNKGLRVSSQFGFRIFYIKKQARSGALVPISFSHNRDENNNRIVRYSLAWQGDDGLAANFHKAWLNLSMNMEVVKTNITCNQKVLQDLFVNNFVEINNVLFLPYKINRTIPLKSTVEIILVPL